MASNDNNKNLAKSNIPEPTMSDLFNLLQRNASKEDINDIRTQISNYTTETNEKIEIVQQQVENIQSANAKNADNIEKSIENKKVLKFSNKTN